jgi:hypothetical protein
MDLEELTAALTGPKPDRGAVLASFRRKHRRRKARRRRCWFCGFAAGVVVAAVAALVFISMAQSRLRSSVTVSPAGCSSTPLAQSLARARQAGASIFIAYGSPTGKTADSGYQGLVLRSVQMLTGPVIASGTTAWTDGTAIRAGADPVAARATGGQVLAIAWPAAVVGSAVGPIVHTAPVIGGNVLLTRSGCGDMANLAAPPNPDPGTVSAGGESAPNGLYAIPLRTVEQAAASPLTGSRQANPQPTVPAQTITPSPAVNAGNSGTSGNASKQTGSARNNGSDKAAAKATKAAAKTAAKATKAAAKASAKAAKGNGNGNG